MPFLVGRSTIEQYLEDILDIFRFEPKKKLREKLVDTDVSDSTDTGLTSAIFSERNDDQFNMGTVESPGESRAAEQEGAEQEGADTGLVRAEEEVATGDMLGVTTGSGHYEGGVAEANMYAGRMMMPFLTTKKKRGGYLKCHLIS
jgi:hypothetical protein